MTEPTYPMGVPVSLWTGSWELVVAALRDTDLLALADEISDQVHHYLGG